MVDYVMFVVLKSSAFTPMSNKGVKSLCLQEKHKGGFGLMISVVEYRLEYNEITCGL